MIYFYVGSRVGKETFRFYTEDKQQTYDDKMCTERTAEISATANNNNIIFLLLSKALFQTY